MMSFMVYTRSSVDPQVEGKRTSNPRRDPQPVTMEAIKRLP